MLKLEYECKEVSQRLGYWVIIKEGHPILPACARALRQERTLEYLEDCIWSTWTWFKWEVCRGRDDVGKRLHVSGVKGSNEARTYVCSLDYVVVNLGNVYSLLVLDLVN